MALEPTPDPNQTPAPPANGDPAPIVTAPVAAQRPDYIPETIWDGEKNAPKIDLAATLTEYGTLKTAADARAAGIPAEGAYKFDLPEGFELPEGFQWKAGADEPLVKAVGEYAKTNNLTQAEVSGLVGVYAASQKAEIANQKAFDADQTKALGENAEGRRKAASDWITANTTPDRAAVLKTMLHYAQGVEAIEDIIAKGVGVTPRGPVSGDPPADQRTPEEIRLAKMYPSMAPAAR